MKQQTRRGPQARQRVTIAGRARKAAACARAEWRALASRLGIEPCIDGSSGPAAESDARRAKLARVVRQFASGTYRVDAQVVAASLINRLLAQTRSPHC